jgi:Fuc2NAc and GlcNAc transferase
LILLGIFIVDATITLIQRFISGAQWYSAHRSHAYQNAARQWGSHRKVTLSILAINIVWLFPLAWLASILPEWGVVFTTFAYLPLFALTIYLKAGKVPISDEQS